ncbi:MAG: hypothetical protein AAGG01_02220 [Planctomycetota bacterium]
MALAFLVLVGSLALLWRLTAGAGNEAVPTVSVGALEAAAVPVAARVELEPVTPVLPRQPEAASEQAVEKEREAAAPEEAWPPGFGQLVVRVVRAGRSVRGVRVSVLGASAEQIVHGEGAERLGQETDERGQVAFFVRPTRTAVVHAIDGETGWSQEGTFTTPFEGRSRMVELEMGTPNSVGAEIRVVSELDGLPLAGVSVEIERPELHLFREAMTDELGAVTVPASPSTVYRFSLERFVTKEIAFDRLDVDSVTTVTLRPLARVHGVLGADGLGTSSRSSRAQESIRVRWRGSLARSTVIHIGDSSGRSKLMPSRDDAKVQADGTWSVDLAIPEAQDALTGVHIDLVGWRTDGHLARLDVVKPGDEIEVPDPWAGADPFTVTFTGPDTQKLVSQASLQLWSVDPLTRSPADMHREISSQGTVRIPRLPVGEWHYRVRVGAMPASEQIQGRFFRAAGEEGVEIDWQGRVVEVSVRREEQRVHQRFRLGIASAGGIPRTTVQISSGERRVLALPSSPGAYDVVLLRSSWPALAVKADGPSEKPEVKLRVPLGSETRSLVLRP